MSWCHPLIKGLRKGASSQAGHFLLVPPRVYIIVTSRCYVHTLQDGSSHHTSAILHCYLWLLTGWSWNSSHQTILSLWFITMWYKLGWTKLAPLDGVKSETSYWFVFKLTDSFTTGERRYSYSRLIQRHNNK